MIGGKLLFCVMQRVPAAGNNPTVQTSLAICHAFPEFEQLYAQAAARLPHREVVEHGKAVNNKITEQCNVADGGHFGDARTSYSRVRTAPASATYSASFDRRMV
jgi:hypothetical protein